MSDPALRVPDPAATRLAVISNGKLSAGIFEEICKVSNGRITLALDLGKARADFVATSLSRLTTRKGRAGHLMEGGTYSGAADVLFQSPDYYRLRDEFTDHMTRNCDQAKLKSHGLQTLDDYHGYYHILCDALAAELVARQVTHLVFTNIPHLAYDTALHHVGRALGLAVLILYQSLFENRLFSMADPAHLGLFRHSDTAVAHAISRNEQPQWFYMKHLGQTREKRGRVSAAAVSELVLFLLRKRPIQALNPFYVAGLVRRMQRIYGGLPKWRDPFASFFHEDSLAYFEHICTLEDQDIDLSGAFVYFPLQMQPEMTTSALGGRFLDQAYAIECLAAMLPADVRILVKENPKQGAYRRGPMFFHRLRRIPSVQFLPSYANTHDLTANARFVATVTGTAGWEAICTGKPALVFGQAWYRKLPGVVEYREGLCYHAVANLTWEHTALEKAVGALLACGHDGVIDAAYAQIVAGFDKGANQRHVARLLIALLDGTQPKSFSAPPEQEATADTPQPRLAPARSSRA